MSQRISKLYNLINHPIVYKIVQKIMSGTSFRKKVIVKNIFKEKVKILDIGCGPAEILDYVPNAEYYGFDIDKRSINFARKKYQNDNHHFFCKRFVKKDLKNIPKVDYVILFGIIHHLTDLEVKKILYLCKLAMKKNAKLLAVDPIYINKQNIIAKFIVSKDRGMNVRTKNQYLKLARTNFKSIKSVITRQQFIPYTWFSMKCKKL
jgi:SAM-dependent methyltransferase